MKTKLLLILLLAVCATTVNSKSINFETTSFQKVLEKAKKEKKTIFVDAYTTWCGPCKRMENNVFTDPDVQKYFDEHFINFRIDMESKEGKDFEETYPIEAYPTLLFINAEGKLILKKTGYRSPEDFVLLGKRVINPADDPLTELNKRYDAGERNLDFIYSYIYALMEDNMPFEEIGVSYLKGIPNAELSKDSVFSIFRMCDNKLGSPHVTYFIENLNEFYYMNGSEGVKEKIGNVLGDNVELLITSENKQLLYNNIIAFIDKTIPLVKRGELVRAINRKIKEKEIAVKLNES
jgi:thioredoxin-related protein